MLRLVVHASILLVLLILPSGGTAALPEKDFHARLDAVVKEVARYDFGGPRDASIALAELIKATHGQPAQRRELADRLAALLAAKVPDGAKDLVCRQLYQIGTGEQVSALAGLLTDEKRAQMARYALERIPGPAPDEALRQALERTRGKLACGVIRSIGVRRDGLAVDALAGRLTNSDAAVAATAAWALGQIATPAAAKALSAALDTPSGRACRAVGEACLLCAERLASQGDRPQATALYDRVASAGMQPPVRYAAARGAILTGQSVDRLLGQLRGDDEMFKLGLSLVREMAGPAIAPAVAGELTRLGAQRQTLLVQALADRGDRSAAGAVLALAEKGDVKVRAAALGALAKLGDAAVAARLIQAAADENAEVATAAKGALVSMSDRDLGGLLPRSLGHANPKVRRAAAEVLGQRRTPGAVDGLLSAAADADPAVRVAAIKALGATVMLQDLDRLSILLLKTSGPAERAAAEEAVAAACVGFADKDACAQRLISLMPRADNQGRSALLRTLSQIGGPKALACVSGSLNDPNPEIQDVVVRALSNWTTAEPMDQLAAIAKDSPNRKHKLLALRGYIRLVGLSNAAPGKKLAMCDQALQWADRDEERKLVLSALGALSTPQALKRCLACLDQPGLNSEAASAAIAVSRRLVDADPAAVATAMTRVAAEAKSAGIKKQATELLNKARAKSRG